MVGQLVPECRIHATRFAVIPTVSGQVRQVDRGTQIRWGERLHLFVTSACVGQEPVTAQQCADIKKPDKIGRLVCQQASAFDHHLLKAARFRTLAQQRHIHQASPPNKSRV